MANATDSSLGSLGVCLLWEVMQHKKCLGSDNPENYLWLNMWHLMRRLDVKCNALGLFENKALMCTQKFCTATEDSFLSSYTCHEIFLNTSLESVFVLWSPDVFWKWCFINSWLYCSSLGILFCPGSLTSALHLVYQNGRLSENEMLFIW